jgi:tellurite resistance protein TerC
MTDPFWWAVFLSLVAGMLAIDLGVFHRHAHEVKFREALTWSVVWVSLALLFNLGIYLGWVGGYPPALREKAALEFLTGYLVEESLSVDNMFVFALLFSYFKVPPRFQHRVLFWGIIGALVMRAGLIFAGIALIKSFHWVIYVFGAILIFSGIKMWTAKNLQYDPAKNPVLKFTRKIFRIAPEMKDQKFFVRIPSPADGKLALAATPLFVVLVIVEWSDLVFAIDSIPAILAITQDPFIVFTSNVLAILGLRSMYFVLAGVMQKFHLLHYGLSALLIFIGVKMLIADTSFKVSTPVSLAVIASCLAISVVASLFFPAKEISELEGGVAVSGEEKGTIG